MHINLSCTTQCDSTHHAQHIPLTTTLPLTTGDQILQQYLLLLHHELIVKSKIGTVEHGSDCIWLPSLVGFHIWVRPSPHHSFSPTFSLPMGIPAPSICQQTHRPPHYHIPVTCGFHAPYLLFPVTLHPRTIVFFPGRPSVTLCPNRIHHRTFLHITTFNALVSTYIMNTLVHGLVICAH